MDKLIEELDKLSDQWGCYGCEDTMDEYEVDVNKHIDFILEKHKDSYNSVETDHVRRGDYYNCYIFAFIDTKNELYLTSVEIEDC